MPKQHYEHTTLPDNEWQLLQHLSLQLGWSRSHILRIAFYELCVRLGLVDPVLRKKRFTIGLSKETGKLLAACQ